MNRIVVPFEMKSANGRTIEGYGSTFGNVDLGGDVVVEGAFKASLADHQENGTQVKMLWNHRMSDLPIGVWTQMSEDKHGLYMKGELADTAMGRDVHTLAKMGAIDSMSIGFGIAEGGYEFAKSGERLITKVNLWEVSPVNFPMNPKAVIEAVKSVFDGARGLEKYLREVGLSKSEARDTVHEVFSGAKPEELPGVDAVEDVDPVMLSRLQNLKDRVVAGSIRFG